MIKYRAILNGGYTEHEIIKETAKTITYELDGVVYTSKKSLLLVIGLILKKKSKLI